MFFLFFPMVKNKQFCQRGPGSIWPKGKYATASWVKNNGPLGNIAALSFATPTVCWHPGSLGLEFDWNYTMSMSQNRICYLRKMVFQWICLF